MTVDWIAALNGFNSFDDLDMNESGTIIWNVECRDGADNINQSINNFTLNIDSSLFDNTPPNVTLLTPAGYVFNNNEIELEYNVVDDFDPTCTLYSDIDQSYGVDKDYDDEPVPNGDNDVPLSDINLGSYEWGIECCDNADNCQIIESTFNRADASSSSSSGGGSGGRRVRG